MLRIHVMKNLLQLCSVLMLGLLFLAGNAQAQDLYVDGGANPVNINCTIGAPCNTLTKAITAAGLLAPAPRTILVTGVTVEPGTVNIPAAIDQYTITGSDPLNPSLSQITMAFPSGANDPILYIADGSINHTIQHLTFAYGTNFAYSQGALVEIFGDGSTFDNVIFRGTTGSNPIRYAVIDDFSGLFANSSGTTIQNSRFDGEFARRTIYLQRADDWVITNNIFLETHVGTNATAVAVGASLYFDSGVFDDMGLTFTYNIVAPLIIDSGVPANNGLFVGIYINQDGALLPTYNQLYEHNTIALRASTYVDDITAISLNGTSLITNMGNGNILISNNIISGATSNGVGLGVDTPAALTTSQFVNNIFFNNGTDFNQPISPLPPYNNLPNTDPMFENGGNPGVNEDYAYLPGSPALGSSTNFPVTPNIGFNQELNSTVPFAYDFAPSGVAPQNLTSPFLANEDITFTWTFVDPDAVDEDPGNPGFPRQTNFIIEFFDGVGTGFPVVTLPFDFYDAVIEGGNASDGWVTSFTLPGGTFPTPLVNTTYSARLSVVDAIALEGGTFDDALQTNPVPYISFVLQANSPPTASNFTVDGVGPNPAVNNVNPVFGFDYDDIDGDALTDIIVDVYRITANCGANCAPLGGPVPVGAVPGLLVTSTTIPLAALAGDPVTFNYYDLVPIQEQLIANETYVWYLRVIDATTNQSVIYNNYAGDGLGVMTFTTVPSSNPSVTDLMVQANAVPLFKDNSVTPRVVLGTAVAEPNLRWTYNGFDTMKSYEVRIVRNPGVGTNPQGELTGPNLVHYTGILPATDPNLNEYLPKQYEWDYQGVIPIQNNQTHFAQVRVYNQLNVASDWVQIDFTRNAAPSATDFLADGDGMVPVPVLFTDDITPTITWTYTDADLAKSPGDEGQSAFHIQIFDNIGFVGAPIVDTGKTASALGTYEVTPDLRLEYDFVYFVRIRVWDGLDVPNHASNWISAGAFRTPVNAPPVLTDILLDGAADGSPAVNYTLNPTPQFDWTFTDPEGRDQFQYSATINDVTNTLSYSFAAPVAGNAAMYVVVPGDFVGFPGFLPGIDYEFELTVWDATSDGSDLPVVGTSDMMIYPFRFVTLPSAPLAMSIDDARVNGSINSLSPTFNFTPSDADGEDAVTYRVQIQDGTNTNIGAPYDAPAGFYPDGTPIAVSLAAMGYADLIANDTYRWRVRTTDIHGNGTFSAWQVFTVNPIPSTPSDVVIEVNPGDNQMNLPNGPTFTVSWTNNDLGFDAVEYQAALFDGANAVSIQNFGMNPVGGVNTGSFTPAVPLTPGTTYTLRLRIGDDASNSNLAEFSVPVSSTQFRISAAPTAADLMVDAVINNPAVEELYPTFSWTFGDVDLDTQSAFEIVVTRTTQNGGGFLPAAPFLVWNSGKISSATPSVEFADGGAIIEGVLPNESYAWTLVVYDTNDIPSAVFNGMFTTISDLGNDIVLNVDGQVYEAGGTPGNRFNAISLNIETPTPDFGWFVSGLTQSQYYIEVNTTSNFDGGSVVWSSGNCVSTTNPVTYGTGCTNAGPGALVTGTTYYARVRVGSGVTEMMNADINANVAIDVNSRTPLLTWNFSDPNLPPLSTDEQTEFVIEISTVLPFVTLFTFNSEGDPGIDGTLSSFQIPANFLKFGTVYAVRIKVKDRYGVQSTNWLQRTFETPPNTAPVISDVMVSDGNVPTDPANVLSLSPDFTWTFTDVDGHGHGFSRVVITNLNGPVVVYDTGILANASAAHTFDPGAVLGAGIAWGQNYRVDVTSWDDFSDPLNFVGPAPTYPDDVNEYDANASLLFSTPAFNLVPVSLSVVPSVINTTQQTQFDAQLSTAFAYGTFVRQNGANFTFLFSVQSDASGQIVIPSGLQPAGTHSIIVFETPIALTGGNWQLSTIGASFASAPLQVVNAGGLLGDANESGTVSALDAVFILQYVAALQTMTPTQIALGDVDGVAGANSFDAALILQFDAGIITCFPLNCPPKGALRDVEAIVDMNRARGQADYTFTVTGNDVVAMQFTLNLAEAGLTSEDITVNTPDGWLSATNEQNGILSVAMAGARAVSSFEFATLRGGNITESTRVGMTMLVNNEHVVADFEVSPALPTEFALDQNFPNPFNPSTEIRFALPEDANVVLEVYNMTGQLVATLTNKAFKAGQHTVRFDASRLSSGVYLYRLQAGKFTASQKMTLIK